MHNRVAQRRLDKRLTVGRWDRGGQHGKGGKKHMVITFIAKSQGENIKHIRVENCTNTHMLANVFAENIITIFTISSQLNYM